MVIVGLAMARKKQSALSNDPIEVDIDTLSGKLGLPTWDDDSDMLETSEAWNYAYKGALEEATDDGLDSEEADEIAREKADTYEGELIDSYYKAWNASRLEALEVTLDHANITLGQENDKWFIAPKESWEDSAAHILEVINGVGHFYFGSVDELLDSGPYTLREAILGHIYILKYYGDVYGTYSTKRIFERALDVNARYL